MRPGVSPPSLPEYDASDPVESAIVRRLASNWARRATVKKAEPELDDLFDSSLSDYPEALLPFAEHPIYLALSPEQKQRLQAWAWIAFNKNVMDIEKYVVNPGFDVLAEDRLNVGLGDWAAVAVNQAMVDEQYHTLMHFNASSATRRGRGWGLPAKALPDVLTVRSRAQALDAAGDPRKIALTQLAFMTVAEVSITAYLDLISDDPGVQSINRATIRLHARDEYCHASIAGELAVLVWDSLGGGDRSYLLEGFEDAMRAFSGTDFGAWRAIMEIEAIPGGRKMLDDVALEPHNELFVQDYSGITSLLQKLQVTPEVTIAADKYSAS
ncbi:diiron oxygenase [Rhodococcus qingshengii]|uniref:diiron oxygenase n=1 Tax=Rhodococcus qingshengii TaxID=334542 RepID=UPI0018DAF539|nr:diiron oxygenase [Rhodococcus qingshengii]QPG88082.1 diiron oxygenase [Rhodococcus qingshengii]